MAGQPRISKRLEAWVDTETRFLAVRSLRRDQIRPERVAEGMLMARAHEKDQPPHEVCVRVEGTRFSFDCDCDRAKGGRVCKHVFGTVLLAESMGVDGFKRRTLIQRSLPTDDLEADDDELDDGEDGDDEPVTPATDADGVATVSDEAEALGVRGDTARVALIEIDGLEEDRRPLRVGLSQCWARRDGSLFSRSQGWRGLTGADLPAALEQQLPRMIGFPLEGERPDEEEWWSGARRDAIRNGQQIRVDADSEEEIVTELTTTGRAVRKDVTPVLPLQWSGREWELVLEPTPVSDDADAMHGEWRVTATLRHRTREVPIESIDAITRGGLVRRGQELSILRPRELAAVVARLREQGGPVIEADELRDFLAGLWELPVAPELVLPDALRPTRVQVEPEGRWIIRRGARDALHGELRFLYGQREIAADDPRERILDGESWQSIERDAEAEARMRLRAAQVLRELRGGHAGDLRRGQLAEVATAMDAAGFEVWTERQRVRSINGAPTLSVRSGIDWFDLEGHHDFGDGVELGLPEMLHALRDKRSAGSFEGAIRLSDGSLGLLPDSWLRRVGKLMQLGEAHGDALRFQRNQAVWVDHLLDSADDDEQATVRCDDAFRRVQQSLREGKSPQPVAPAASFVGELRPYQQAGLGWLQFLSEVGFGGILADDMGLGKTVQVLAFLEERRLQQGGPSLVVAPRSVVHQWIAEAARFTPGIDAMAHVGPQRTLRLEDLQGHQLIVTSYGVLRRDTALLARLEWDLLILDEAQAVKNASTVTSQAVRRLPARQRLVVTGTPVENHLGELANHLDFLNPGLFGKSSALRERFSRRMDADTARAVARALEPLLLRRTKAQVAQELPERVEQDLLCEMSGAQKKFYAELRRHYALNLLPEARNRGVSGMQFQVLEALLRLRQAACHPALVDPQYQDLATAKFDVLLPRLEELIDEGAKALVFSQFTKYLALLKKELDRRGIVYESLDGSTRNREERIRRFQEDATVPLFLISLKAGGVGLNLTAAQYVFLLDPWWNPAVEAQAIDRAHRHGQVNQVVAYRLLARDSVEQKIRELQERKQALAEAILGGDGAVLRALSASDLEVLLG